MVRDTLLILAVLGTLLQLVVAQDSGCAVPAVATYCFSEISAYYVPQSLSQAAANTNASDAVNNAGNGCPLYFTRKYQCWKYFPRCTNSSGNYVEQRICRSSCREAKTADDGLCKRYSDQYFNDECNSNFYSDTNCIAYEFPSSSDNNTWKYVLVGVLGVVGLVLLASYFRTRYKEWRYDPNNDPHIDDVLEADARSNGCNHDPNSYQDLNVMPLTAPTRDAPPTLEERAEAFKRSQMLTQQGQWKGGTQTDEKTTVFLSS